MSIKETLERAILWDQRSIPELARDAGVCKASIYRFVDSAQGLNSATIGKICEALGLELVERGET